ncbi:MAG TPA: RidA family protein, partial [Kofleriaceae bacterium]|nr:RidA family protein [Kofleriaceae bacterium]
PAPVLPAYQAVFAHGVEVPPGARTLYVSGQVGIGDDGRTVEGGFDAQCGQAIANVEAVLASAGMALDDIVKVTFYLTRREDIPRLRDIRAERLAVAPTVTMVLVAGLHAPDWLVEIEVVAAAT